MRFDNLKFKPHLHDPNGVQATAQFVNGYNHEAANKFRCAALALEASERTTNPFTRQMWRNHAATLQRQGREIIRHA